MHLLPFLKWICQAVAFLFPNKTCSIQHFQPRQQYFDGCLHGRERPESGYPLVEIGQYFAFNILQLFFAVGKFNYFFTVIVVGVFLFSPVNVMPEFSAER